MNKKFLGIRVGTILAIIGSIATALIVWVVAKYSLGSSQTQSIASTIIPNLISRG